jgi:hypothetical protein
MACETIKSFTYDRCEANLGGIKKVWLSDYKENAATLTEDGSGVSAFAEGVTWHEYPMRKNVASMTSTLNTSTDGAVYVTTELAMVFSKMETQKRIAVQALALGECMAIVEDSNGKLWFLGKDAPLTASAGAGETGTAKGDRNAYTITLTDEAFEFPLEVANTIKPNANAE